MATDSFWDVLHRLDSSDLSLIIGLFMGFMTATVIVLAAGISRTIYAIHRSRLEDALKRELVDRGFSVEEIARIVEASATRRLSRPKQYEKSIPARSENEVVAVP